MIDKNYKYHCDYDYESYFPCQNGSDCCDNDYCRCEEITKVWITETPNLEGLALREFNKRKTKKEKGFKVSEIDAYCLERILSINNLWDPEEWTINIGPGYYGEEIDSIKINHFAAKKIKEETAHLLKLKTNRQKIEYVLTLEYGHVLPALKNKIWKVKKIKKEDVSYPKQWFGKLNQDAATAYTERILPRGIVLEEEGRYRVYDGRHRIYAAKGSFKVISAKK